MNTTDKILMAGVVLFIVTASSCTYSINHHDNETMLDMVKSGSTAADAHCAVKGDSSKACMVLAIEKIVK